LEEGVKGGKGIKENRRRGGGEMEKKMMKKDVF
jgi:hypothetical protein